MNDFVSLEKLIVRDLSCRLCLCSDVAKLKPLSEEVKRKIKKLFNVAVRTDDNLPKAICHDCLHQVSSMYLYTVKVDKTQKFLVFHKMKALEERKAAEQQESQRIFQHPLNIQAQSQTQDNRPKKPKSPKKEIPPTELQQGDTKQLHQDETKRNQEDTKTGKHKVFKKKASPTELKYMESMTLEEFADSEKVDKSLLENKSSTTKKSPVRKKEAKRESKSPDSEDFGRETLDPVVLVDGRPARQGAALDRQVTLFYKMECCICHEKGFNFKSLMKHYKDRHGVPGYVTCCNKKFHYFYPKKIIEHMAYHLQPNIFMCASCHQNFQNSQELKEHQANGGKSEGKLVCPRCTEKFPTYRELGWHVITHRTDKPSCDYCGKMLKHQHRKKTVNHMEDLVLCSHCIRVLRSIEKQEKETKEKNKLKFKDTAAIQRHQRFRDSLDMSAEDGSTD